MNRAILSAMLGLKICLYGQSLAQSQVPDVNSRLLRIASERERILQYAVQCKIEGPLGNLSSFEPKWVSDNNTKVELYYEYSRIEQHYITAIRNLETPVRRWVLLGTSRDKKLAGRTGGEMQVIRLDSVAERAYSQADARHTKLKSFDPMAIGLVFCGDFYNGLSFEAQLGDLLNNRKDFSKLVEEGDSVT